MNKALEIYISYRYVMPRVNTFKEKRDRIGDLAILTSTFDT